MKAAAENRTPQTPRNAGQLTARPQDVEAVRKALAPNESQVTGTQVTDMIREDAEAVSNLLKAEGITEGNKENEYSY